MIIVGPNRKDNCHTRSIGYFCIILTALLTRFPFPHFIYSAPELHTPPVIIAHQRMIHIGILVPCQILGLRVFRCDIVGFITEAALNILYMDICMSCFSHHTAKHVRFICFLSTQLNPEVILLCVITVLTIQLSCCEIIFSKYFKS